MMLEEGSGEGWRGEGVGGQEEGRVTVEEG